MGSVAVGKQVESQMAAVSPVEVGDREAFELLKEAGCKEIDSQADCFNQLDAKVGVILGFALVAIVQILGSLFRSMPANQALIAVYPKWFFGLFALAIVSILAAILFAVFERWPRRFFHGAELHKLQPNAPSVELLRKSTIRQIRGAIKKNDIIVSRKRDFANYASISVVFGLFCFTVLLLVAFVVKPVQPSSPTPPRSAESATTVSEAVSGPASGKATH